MWLKPRESALGSQLESETKKRLFFSSEGKGLHWQNVNLEPVGDSHQTTRRKDSHLRIKLHRGKKSQDMARGRPLTALGHVDPTMPEETYTMTLQFYDPIDPP